jgi:sacsin
MAPQPRKQNPQRQPLTSYLRKICRDYPAGAGVLKELLQNADDAGASTIVRLIRCSSIFIKNADKVQRFVLDTRTHPDSPVLVDGLSEYQGAALLAYNDAIFSEEDFESLTSLGDSKKIQDKVATGKFGLGFSSVCFKLKTLVRFARELVFADWQ